jgi:ionotropic glutamate receptor NMDA 1
MRTVPSYAKQSEIWADLLDSLGFKHVIFIHSSDQEGRAMLGKFQSKTDSESKKIEKSIAYTSGQSDYLDELRQIQNLTSRVILLYATAEDAEIIYRDAASLNLIDAGYAWIVTEQAVQPRNTPKGVLSTQLVNGKDEDAHISDAVAVIALAVSQIHRQNISLTAPPSACDETTRWDSGPKILRILQNQELVHGRTGNVSFNDAGDRLNALYDIINVQNHGNVVVGSRVIGDDKERKDLKQKKLIPLNEKAIIWPGYETQKPKGIKISTHLRVVTIKEQPFIYTVPLSETAQGQCNLLINHLPCSKPNSSGGPPTEFCCYGYAMDLLVKLANSVNFTYDLHLVEDNSYGTFEKHNNSSLRVWNGMIGELIYDKADMIVAPLTISPERAEVIDFSKPFKYQGLTILVKKTTKDSNLGSFLQPFGNTLWILVGLSVHVVALVLYLLDRFSPFGRFKLAKNDDTEEDALNLSSAMWFAWGVLLNSGIGEGTPRSFSARVLGMVWAGFAMIIVASYTANLAAFLVLDRPEASISGIDDARLRNPQEKFKYATVKNSAVAMYFKRQVELSTMYRTMEGHNYDTPEDAIRDLKERKLQAFIWDSSRLDYEAAQNCDLVTAGELFGRSGYGIGLQKNSPWTQEISLQILALHENGSMEDLDGKWILAKDTACPEKDTSPATLGLTNMAGVFMMVAFGIVAGIFIISIEIAYKRHRRLKEKELELAKTAADRWRGNIEKRRTLRRTLLQYQRDCQNLDAATGGSSSTLNPAETTKPSLSSRTSPIQSVRLPASASRPVIADYQAVASSSKADDVSV